eukprot:SM000245S08173  [mRNA]  locus=s245:40279:51919:+ [translate_table: standard]
MGSFAAAASTVADERPALVGPHDRGSERGSGEEGGPGWFYNGRDGGLHGPFPLVQLKRWLTQGLLPLDHLVFRGGSNVWLTLENAQSPPPPPLPRSQLPPSPPLPPPSPRSGASSAAFLAALARPLSSAGSRPEALEANGDRVSVPLADQDGASGPALSDCGFSDATEESGSKEGGGKDSQEAGGKEEEVDQGLAAIDRRVEQLMQGFRRAEGHEKEIVTEALRSASRRAAEDSDVEWASEEWPRSHRGPQGFAEPWQYPEFGSKPGPTAAAAAPVPGLGLEASSPAAKLMKEEDLSKVESERDSGMPAWCNEEASSQEVAVVGNGGALLRGSNVAGLWPLRGGDWCWETTEQVAGAPAEGVKRVVNGGRPLCLERSGGAVDPRPPPTAARPAVPAAGALLALPDWACKAAEAASGSSLLEAATSHGLSVRVRPPGAGEVSSPSLEQGGTPRSQGSTPRAVTPSKGRGFPVAIKPPTGSGGSSGETAKQQGLSVKGGSRVLSPSAAATVQAGARARTTSGGGGIKPAGVPPRAGSRPVSRRAEEGGGRMEILPLARRNVEVLKRQALAVTARLPREDVGDKDVVLGSPPPESRLLQGPPFMPAEPAGGCRGSQEGSSPLLSQPSPGTGRAPSGAALAPSPGSQSWGDVKDAVLQEQSSVDMREDSQQSAASAEQRACLSEHGGVALPWVATVQTQKSGNKGEPDSGHQRRAEPSAVLGTAAHVCRKLHESVVSAYRTKVLAAALKDALSDRLGSSRQVNDRTLDPVSRLLPDGRDSATLSPASTGIVEDGPATISRPDGLRSINGFDVRSDNQVVGAESTSQLRSSVPQFPGAEKVAPPSTSHDGHRPQRRMLSTLDTDSDEDKGGTWGGTLSLPNVRDTQAKLSEEDIDVLNAVARRIDCDARQRSAGGQCRPMKARLLGATPDLTEVDHCLKPRADSWRDQCGAGQGWAELPSSALVQVLACLRGNLQSLVRASATCKAWRLAVTHFMPELRMADLSDVGTNFQTEAFASLQALKPRGLKRASLKKCTQLSLKSVESLLQTCPSISELDITGCAHLRDLPHLHPEVCFVDEGMKLGVRNGKIARLSADSGKKLRGVATVKHVKAVPGSDNLNHDFYQNGAVVRNIPGNALDRVSGGLQKSMPGSTYQSGGVGRARLANGAGWSRSNNLGHPSGKAKVGSKRGSAEKQTSNKSEKVTLIGRELESVLRKLVAMDKKRIFTQPMTDDVCPKYSAKIKVPMDLSLIEKRLRQGVYSGGAKAADEFFSDISRMCRNVWQCEMNLGTKSPLYNHATELFKENHRLNAAFMKAIQPDLSRTKSVLIKAKPSSKSSGRRRKVEEGVLTKPGRKRRRNENSSSEEEEGSVDDSGEDDIARRKGVAREKQTVVERNPWSESEDEDESSGSEIDDDDFTEFLTEPAEVERREKEKAKKIEEKEEEEWKKRCAEMGIGAEERQKRKAWGNSMNSKATVPPITRKYEVINEYFIVEEEEEVQQKMVVHLPETYANSNHPQANAEQYCHLDVPDLKKPKPRKVLGKEVVEQEVYGIDPFTHNLLLDTMPSNHMGFLEQEDQQAFIEETLLLALNKEAQMFGGELKAPMELPLDRVMERVIKEAEEKGDSQLGTFTSLLLANMRARPKDKYNAYRKGLGVICNSSDGFTRDDFVVEFFGEVYPPWRWFEKQDGIRFIQKKESVTEFYNIYLERPKADAAGYDVLIVDAMHRANFASRLCHSCRPNCEAKVTAVDGKYMIGVYTLRQILSGEELTFDYNSVTESQEEYKQAVCLCGHRLCKGSYLSLNSATTFQQVISEHHGLLDRHCMLLEACSSKEGITAAELEQLAKSGFGKCLLNDLPDWAVKYAARLVEFIAEERKLLPAILYKEGRKGRRRPMQRLQDDGEDSLEAAQEQAEGVWLSRLQNLAITLDKVRYCLKVLYGEAKEGLPPLRILSPRELIQKLWTGDGSSEASVVNQMLKCVAPHMEKAAMARLWQEVRSRDGVPETTAGMRQLRVNLLWLRDYLLTLESSAVSRHDAAADLLHLYAHTETFFTTQEYDAFDSPPLVIRKEDLGLRSGGAAVDGGDREWSKTYDRDHILGQLVYWFKQTVADPGHSLAAARRGCLVLPDPSSCYSRNQQQAVMRAYGPQQRKEMFDKMENKPQKYWQKANDKWLWDYRNRQLYGSPMLDATMAGRSLCGSELMTWLRDRPVKFVGPYDS